MNRDACLLVFKGFKFTDDLVRRGIPNSVVCGVLARGVDNEHGRSAACELNKVEGEDAERGFFGGIGDVEEVDCAWYIANTVDACHDSELCSLLCAPYAPALVFDYTR